MIISEDTIFCWALINPVVRHRFIENTFYMIPIINGIPFFLLKKLVFSVEVFGERKKKGPQHGDMLIVLDEKSNFFLTM